MTNKETAFSKFKIHANMAITSGLWIPKLPAIYTNSTKNQETLRGWDSRHGSNLLESSHLPCQLGQPVHSWLNISWGHPRKWSAFPLTVADHCQSSWLSFLQLVWRQLRWCMWPQWHWCCYESGVRVCTPIQKGICLQHNCTDIIHSMRAHPEQVHCLVHPSIPLLVVSLSKS